MRDLIAVKLDQSIGRFNYLKPHSQYFEARFKRGHK
jgi:hypothetical protein